MRLPPGASRARSGGHTKAHSPRGSGESASRGSRACCRRCRLHRVENADRRAGTARRCARAGRCRTRADGRGHSLQPPANRLQLLQPVLVSLHVSLHVTVRDRWPLRDDLLDRELHLLPVGIGEARQVVLVGGGGADVAPALLVAHDLRVIGAVAQPLHPAAVLRLTLLHPRQEASHLAARLVPPLGPLQRELVRIARRQEARFQLRRRRYTVELAFAYTLTDAAAAAAAASGLLIVVVGQLLCADLAPADQVGDSAVLRPRVRFGAHVVLGRTELNGIAETVSLHALAVGSDGAVRHAVADGAVLLDDTLLAHQLDGQAE